MTSVSLVLLIFMTVYCDSFKLPSLPSKRISVSRKMMINSIGAPTQDAMNWYMNSLASSPIITKGVTTGVIEVLGDAIAQLAERKEKVDRKWEYRRSLGCFIGHVAIPANPVHVF